jgi:MoaA/NifB/PqqE/SkfB family radical SAM enzyme
LYIQQNSEENRKELSFEEIKKIASDARQMGCRQWSISGGEPMLRPDFEEIFDYLTSNSCGGYSLNTNGTLITKKIAKLLKRKGTKMVALYGATAQVHDHVTRNPGSFEATMAGFAYLKEAGVGFTVQLIPMKDSYHQFKDMVKLAESLSKYYRVGAAWLYLSASGDKDRNAEIKRQRLLPKEVVELDKPDLSYEEWQNEKKGLCSGAAAQDSHLFASCLAGKRDFHIDPYGKASFCCFLKDASMRYDLKKRPFSGFWEDFIPSLAKKVRIGEEYRANCGSCNFKKDCGCCPVYSYLEHRDYSAKVDYLCAVAKENRKFKENWQKKHRRFYRIADITVRVESDLPIGDATFHQKFMDFEANGPTEDMVTIRHHFSLPLVSGKNLGKEVYRKAPWAVYKKNDSWVFLGIFPAPGDRNFHKVAVFNRDFTRANIYNNGEEIFLKGDVGNLTLLQTDQILLARVLADRQGCYLHASGVEFAGKGFLFVGHSEAGKSTMVKLLNGKAKILCDDRMIVRQRIDGFKIYGTWSHGEVPQVSGDSAPLSAIFFLNKANDNRIENLKDKKTINRKLLACLIKPFVTVEWWEKTLPLLEKISTEVPCYSLYFDKSGKIVDLLGRF